VTSHNASHQSLTERELELAVREAELNRREATLRRAAEARAEEEGSPTRASSALHAEPETRNGAVTRRERELEQMLEAVDAQRGRLEAVRLEYESRREALAERMREVEAERDRLRDEQARLVTASLELEERERAAAAQEAANEAAPAERPPDAEWWSKQLGRPLEAA